MENGLMKKVYLVDSENVADLWVTHLMKLAEPEDDIIVFYTAKSPHMGYEHIRMLLNSTHEVEFVKCAEGQNALDFQLVTELGYRLGGMKEDIEYIIVTNDNGFDAVVKYWQSREMPVKRYNAKYCHNLVNQQEVARKTLEEKVQKESELENISITIQLLQELQEESKGKEEGDVGVSKNDITQNKKNEETIAKVQKITTATTLAEKENKIEAVIEPLVKNYKTGEVAEISVKENKTEKIAEPLNCEKNIDNKKRQDIVIEEKESTIEKEQDIAESLVKALVSCIGTKNIPDIHNALICLLGSQKGKLVYKQVKGKLNDYAPTNKIQIKNRFKTYCQIVFEHSEQKEECPKDFFKFVYDAKDKRKNLNSFRSALQNEYGKEKGMCYYTIIKPHVKILNRMQNA